MHTAENGQADIFEIKFYVFDFIFLFFFFVAELLSLQVPFVQ